MDASPTGALIERLRQPAAYPHPVDRVELIETHASFVLLAGDFAYKIKKPVRLPFLDFSSLEKRRFFCEEELRLNRRTAPGLYLGVVAIGGVPASMDSREEPVEYALKMRRFAQDALLGRMAREGRLGASHVEALGRHVARFHAAAPRAAPCVDAIARVVARALDNFRDIDALEPTPAVHATLARLHDWTREQAGALARRIALRHAQGFVRECHGDLHLANAVWLGGEPVAYDCIEFDPRLRWIDVMGDIAFTMMDLAGHGLPRLATRLLNAYLEETGDYGGLRVLRFYLVYRAMVRAKVARIRMHQGAVGVHDYVRALEEFQRHLLLAEELSRPGVPLLVLMHGLAGSGKTTASTRLAEGLGAVRVRSDVERKRLHGMAAAERSGSGLAEGLYTPDKSRRTYAHLAVLAHEVLAAGFPVVVDAAALTLEQRERFRRVARAAGADFEIASCIAPEASLRERVAARQSAASDASEAGLAVLALQRAAIEPLTDAERKHSVILDTAVASAWEKAVDSLASARRG